MFGVGKRLARGGISAMICLALAACAVGAGGDALLVPASSTAPKAGKALVKIRRVEGLLYAAAPASVKLNGAKVADLWPGGSTAFEISPGKSTISVDAWSYPGAYSATLDAKANTAYAFEVAPREASLGPSMVLGPGGGLVDQGENGNAGAFQIRPVAVAAAEVPTKVAKKR